MSISQNPYSFAAPRELYDGEQGLTDLEASLGLPPQGSLTARIDRLLAEVQERIARWESEAAEDLLADHAIISNLFAVTEKVGMAAYFNDGGLPDVWWAQLGVGLRDSGLFDRLIKQIHRETYAKMAHRSIWKMANTFSEAKLVSPDTEGALLAAARAAAVDVGRHLDAMEKLDDASLRAYSRSVLEWHDALVEKFAYAPPPGMGHEPEVLKYRAWQDARGMGFMQEWSEIVRSIPNRGAERLAVLVERVERLLTVTQYLSDNSAASANARWARLEPVKSWVIAQRKSDAAGSRAAFVRRVVPQVRQMAKEAGEALSGDDQAVTRTVTGWLRSAGVK